MNYSILLISDHFVASPYSFCNTLIQNFSKNNERAFRLGLHSVYEVIIRTHNMNYSNKSICVKGPFAKYESIYNELISNVMVRINSYS